jgi:hypothetical protein
MNGHATDRERLAIRWMRRSHAAYKQGNRTEDVRRGERAYQKWRKRVQRSQEAA